MSITLDAADATREDARLMARRLATPKGYEETKGVAMSRAARALGVTSSFYRRLIDGNLKTIPAHIYLQMKAKLDEVEAKTARQADLAKQIADAAEGPHETNMECMRKRIVVGLTNAENRLERLKFNRD